MALLPSFSGLAQLASANTNPTAGCHRRKPLGHALFRAAQSQNEVLRVPLTITHQLCLVSTCSGTCWLAWRRWIEDCIHKNFARMVAEGQYLKVLDRIRRCLLRAGNHKFRNCCAAQLCGSLDQTLLSRRDPGL